ncbi:AraC family transcriptional regulator [Chloroflexi bacterium TSY]|nr:AraC family transcriptional regulator [Chloroflexi bacterium TSY]
MDAQELRHATQLILRLEEEQEWQVPGYESMIQSLFSQLVVFLARKYAEQTAPITKSILELAQVVAYIEEHFDHASRLDDLADCAAMPPNHFLRVFKATYNMPPIAYILRLRIDKARLLLRETDEPVSDIAAQVGFTDSNYFTRKFKNTTSYTPTEYRRLTSVVP